MNMMTKKVTVGFVMVFMNLVVVTLITMDLGGMIPQDFTASHVTMTFVQNVFFQKDNQQTIKLLTLKNPQIILGIATH